MAWKLNRQGACSARMLSTTLFYLSDDRDVVKLPPSVNELIIMRIIALLHHTDTYLCFGNSVIPKHDAEIQAKHDEHNCLWMQSETVFQAMVYGQHLKDDSASHGKHAGNDNASKFANETATGRTLVRVAR